MRSAAANTAEIRRSEADERLPALVCVSVWFTAAGGMWALLLAPVLF
jgi:hypothetical protein